MNENVLKDGVQLLPLKDVKPYKLNNKQHPESQINRLAHSIATYGFDQNIVVDKDNVIIKGHGRYFAAKKLELEEVPVFRNLTITDEEAKQSRIADNKVAESEWDTDVLWEEMNEALNEDNMSLSDLGFSRSTLKKKFDDKQMEELGFFDPKDEKEINAFQKGRDSEEEEDDVIENRDPTLPKVDDGSIAPFLGDQDYLRKMPIVDYLNLHKYIYIGISGGKDSTAALLWCLENLPKEKLIPYYVNLGHGIDWPCMSTYLKYLEHRYDIKIYFSGFADPDTKGGFYKYLIQLGFPVSYSCWLRNYVKIGAAEGFRKWHGEQYNLKPLSFDACFILSVRWAEAKEREDTYPDRGVSMDSKMHFASPLVAWTDTDLVKYFSTRDIKLPPPYMFSNRSGCLICPNNSRADNIALRKTHPELWAQTLYWYSLAGRRRKGEMAMATLQKFISTLEDLTPEQMGHFKSHYNSMALDPTAFEDFIEKTSGKKLVTRPFTTIPFNKKYHNFQNETPSEYLKVSVGEKVEGKICELYK